jgi:hypothetical protein
MLALSTNTDVVDEASFTDTLQKCAARHVKLTERLDAPVQISRQNLTS